MQVEEGKRYQFTVTGTVAKRASYFSCCLIEDDDGHSHWIYVDGDTVKIQEPVPEYENGLYMDSDGELFIRVDGDWFHFNGGRADVASNFAARLRLVNLPYDADPYCA